MQAVEIKLPFEEVKIETVYENNNEGSHFRPVLDSIRVYKMMFGGSTAFKFLLSSLTAFAVNYGIYALMLGVKNDVTPGWITLATLVAWVISSFTNFMINRVIVFKKKDGFFASFIQYYSLAVFVYLAKLGVVQLLVYLHISEYVALPIAEAVLFVMNYFVQKLIIFRKKKPKNEVKNDR